MFCTLTTIVVISILAIVVMVVWSAGYLSMMLISYQGNGLIRSQNQCSFMKYQTEVDIYNEKLH
jgi:bacteriorhodopsin